MCLYLWLGSDAQIQLLTAYFVSTNEYLIDLKHNIVINLTMIREEV